MATVDDFHKIEMMVGTILTAEYIEGADKLLKLTVDFGPLPKPEVPAVEQSDATATPLAPADETAPTQDIRQILSGIRAYYEPEQLIGKQCPFVTNLDPRTMRGLVSYGMILAAGPADGGAVLLHPDKPIPNGTKLR